MLEIINNLKPFFEDCYRRISVREYAKLIKVSPPKSSKLLYYFNREGLLKKEKYRNYLFFYANINSKEFTDLSRLYWYGRLKDFLSYLEKKLVNPAIILFGSLSKAEAKKDSDIDLSIFAHKKELNLESFEKKLGRKVQIFWFKSIADIKDKELANNIVNGYLLRGNLIF
ncbi:MAG: nucleotidyltransferase domain-containing protein [Nanoarchaeota archaeon]